MTIKRRRKYEALSRQPVASSYPPIIEPTDPRTSVCVCVAEALSARRNREIHEKKTREFVMFFCCCHQLFMNVLQWAQLRRCVHVRSLGLCKRVKHDKAHKGGKTTLWPNSRRLESILMEINKSPMTISLASNLLNVHIIIVHQCDDDLLMK